MREKRNVCSLPGGRCDGTHVVHAEARRRRKTRSEEFQELFGRKPDVLEDLAQKIWRDVPAGVKRNSRHSAISVTKLFVRSALTNLREAQLYENADNLPRLEDRQLRHVNLLERAASPRTRP